MSGALPSGSWSLLGLGLIAWLGYAGILPWSPLADPGVGRSEAHLLAVRSDNGLQWTGRAEILARGWSSPDLVQVGGQDWLFVEDGPGLGVARLAEEGGWRLTPLKLRGLPPGTASAPSAIVLGDGLVRLYFLFTPEAESAPTEVRSAVQVEGGAWQVEPGLRVSRSGLQDVDALALYGGGVRLYVVIDDQLQSMLSDDGISFHGEGVIKLEGAPQAISVVMTRAGVYVWYLDRVGSTTRVRSAIAKDGWSFRPEIRLKFDPVPDIYGADRRYVSLTAAPSGRGWRMVVGLRATGYRSGSGA